MKKTTIAAGFAVMALSTVAYAAPGMMEPRGPVTLAEAKARSAEMFAHLDVNGDGQLDDADREARRAQIFAKIDTNGDGQISKAEFAAMHEGHEMHEGHGGPIGDHMGGPKGGPMGDRHGRHGGHFGPMMGKMADTNHDGVITRAEFDAGVEAHFARVDTNGDGTISPEERKAAHEKMRERFEQAREDRAED